MKRAIYVIILIISLLGLIVSSYLTYNHYTNQSVLCITGKHAKICDDVLRSPYSSLLFNLPNSLTGVFGFFVLFILSYLGFKKKKIENLLLLFSSIAFLFILYLAYLIFFVIKSFCIWCFIAWILLIIIFICSILIKTLDE